MVSAVAQGWTERWTERSGPRIRYLDNAPERPRGLPILFSPGLSDTADEYHEMLEWMRPRSAPGGGGARSRGERRATLGVHGGGARRGPRGGPRRGRDRSAPSRHLLEGHDLGPRPGPGEASPYRLHGHRRLPRGGDRPSTDVRRHAVGDTISGPTHEGSAPEARARGGCVGIGLARPLGRPHEAARTPPGGARAAPVRSSTTRPWTATSRSGPTQRSSSCPMRPMTSSVRTRCSFRRWWRPSRKKSRPWPSASERMAPEPTPGRGVLPSVSSAPVLVRSDNAKPDAAAGRGPEPPDVLA